MNPRTREPSRGRRRGGHFYLAIKTFTRNAYKQAQAGRARRAVVTKQAEQACAAYGQQAATAENSEIHVLRAPEITPCGLNLLPWPP